MKRVRASLFVLSLIMVFLTACGEQPTASNDEPTEQPREMTLDFSFGQKEGTYQGEMNDNGLPDGYGSFTSKNSEGMKWTYTGYFKNGHFEGEGETVWDDGTIERGIYKNDDVLPLDSSFVPKVYTNAEEYVDYVIEITGRVINIIENTDYLCFQAVEDIDNNINNTVVYYDNSYDRLDLITNEFVHIVGKVRGQFEAENIFGKTITGIEIDAYEVEKISYMDAARPTLKSVDVNKAQTQYGYTVTVQKVEFAEKETRVYIRVDNEGKEKFSLQTYSATLSQNGKQIERQINYNADYPDIQTQLRPGNYSEGIITFPPLAYESLTLYCDGSSYVWNENIETFIIDVPIEE